MRIDGGEREDAVAAAAGFLGETTVQPWQNRRGLLQLRSLVLMNTTKNLIPSSFLI